MAKSKQRISDDELQRAATEAAQVALENGADDDELQRAAEEAAWIALENFGY